MKTPECPHEEDTLTAVFLRRWPDGCDDSLVAHAGECEVCRELVEVASLLSQDRRAIHESVSVPAAGQVWWRAAIRARLEANQTASRPLTWLFGAATASAIGLAVAVAGLLLGSVQQAASWVNPLAWLRTFDVSGLTAALSPVAWIGGLLMLGAVACIVLAPLALYVVLSDD